MTTVIDLGGAPANEECAQLGHTANFTRVNMFEVLAYRVALIAVHGMPPEGCTLTPRANHHDFGTYYSLGLEISEQANLAAARAYAEKVEDGLESWLEAGMAPPVIYGDGKGHIERNLTGVIRGALATTRPAPDGTFPVPAFATLHANLAAAYPREAAQFRQAFHQGAAA